MALGLGGPGYLQLGYNPTYKYPARRVLDAGPPDLKGRKVIDVSRASGSGHPGPQDVKGRRVSHISCLACAGRPGPHASRARGPVIYPARRVLDTPGPQTSRVAGSVICPPGARPKRPKGQQYVLPSPDFKGRRASNGPQTSRDATEDRVPACPTVQCF